MFTSHQKQWQNITRWHWNRFQRFQWIFTDSLNIHRFPVENKCRKCFHYNMIFESRKSYYKSSFGIIVFLWKILSLLLDQGLYSPCVLNIHTNIQQHAHWYDHIPHRFNMLETLFWGDKYLRCTAPCTVAAGRHLCEIITWILFVIPLKWNAYLVHWWNW